MQTFCGMMTGSLEKSDELKAACRKWEKTGITRWDFGDLPEFVSDSGNKKARWIAYPHWRQIPQPIRVSIFVFFIGRIKR